MQDKEDKNDRVDTDRHEEADNGNKKETPDALTY